MSTFDRNVLPWGLTPELVDLTNAAIEQLAARKISSIVVREESGHTIGNLIRCYLQAHIRRLLIFVDAGAAELGAQRTLVANQCVRAIYENVASVCDFADKIVPMMDARDYQKIADFVSARAFSTRLPHLIAQHGNSISATNVLTQIDRMTKLSPDYREAYEHLSDIVHPNGMGAVVYFVKLEDSIATIFDDGVDPSKAHASLIMGAFLLNFAELSIREIEKRLETLCSSVSAL